MGVTQSNEQYSIRKSVDGKINKIPVILPPSKVHSSSSIATMDSNGSDSLRSVTPINGPAIADDDNVMLAKLLETYECGKLVGKGSSGHVFEVIDKETKIAYACKVIHKNFMMNDDGTMTTETEIMKRLAQDNVVRLHELYETTTSKWLIMELANAGTVQNALAEEEHYNEKKIAQVFKQILLGVKYLHDMGIVHRDLKQDNILCAVEERVGEEREYTPKIADFGLSAILNTKKYKTSTEQRRAMKSYKALKQLWGTTEYFAPEVHKKAYGPQADVWALGCVLYELLTGATAFPVKEKQASRLELLLLNGGKKIRRYFEHNAAYDGLSAEAKDLVQRMLKVNPNKRFDIDECLEHPWIANCDNEDSSAVVYPERTLAEAKNLAVKRANHKAQKNKLLTAELEQRAGKAAAAQ